MIDCITTNETQFFREPRHFDFLERQVFPHWHQEATLGRPKHLRVWSAGCSSGEEPYSLAITVMEAIADWPDHDISILATDIDKANKVLEQGVIERAFALVARRGRHQRARDLPRGLGRAAPPAPARGQSHGALALRDGSDLPARLRHAELPHDRGGRGPGAGAAPGG